MRETSMKYDYHLNLISNNEFSYRAEGNEKSITVDFPLNEKYMISYVNHNFIHLVEGLHYTISDINEQEINLLFKVRKNDLINVGYIVFEYIN
jgi:hypothetical protein